MGGSIFKQTMKAITPTHNAGQDKYEIQFEATVSKELMQQLLEAAEINKIVVELK